MFDPLRLPTRAAPALAPSLLRPSRLHARWQAGLGRAARWVLLLALAALPLGALATSEAAPDTTPAAALSPGGTKPLPLQFVPNVGQWPQEALLYLTRAADVDALFRRDHIELRARDPEAPSTLRLRPLDAATAELQPGTKRVTVVNDYRGQDPARWHSGIPTYEALRYVGLYPNIDLAFRTQARQLAYDFILHPGADPARIRVALEGARELSIEPDGSLRVLLPNGRAFRQPPPVIYQERDGEREPVRGRFQLLTATASDEAAPVYGFKLGDYDPSRVLVIDPTLEYANFVGSSGDETISGMQVIDGGPNGGDVLVVGTTDSEDFAVGFNPNEIVRVNADGTDILDEDGELVYSLGGDIGFVYQMAADGTNLVFVTLLGGSDDDVIHDVAIDSSGNILVAGATDSEDFPIINPRFGVLQGGTDAFVIKLDAAGQLIMGPTGFSSYYGGDGDTSANAIALDGDDNIYIAGVTDAPDLVLRNPLYPTLAGDDDGFIVQFSSNTTSSMYDVEYATYFGGSDDDSIEQLLASDTFRSLVSDTGDLFLAGHTSSAATDRDGNPDFPVKHAVQPVLGGDQDVFLARIARGGGELVFNTYVGGSDEDFLTELAMDADQHYLLSGYTSSEDWPTHNALMPDYPLDSGNEIGTIAKVDRSGRFFHFSTYFGSTGDDRVLAVTPIPADPYALSAYGDRKIYVAGITDSNTFPVQDAFQSFHVGNGDGFLTTLGTNGQVIHFSTFFGGTEADGIVAVEPDPSNPMTSAIIAGYTEEEDDSVMFPQGNVPRIAPHAGDRDTFVARLDDISNDPRPPVLWLDTDLDPRHPEAALAPSPFHFDFDLMLQDRQGSFPAVRGVTGFSTRLYYDPTQLSYVDHEWHPILTANPIITTLQVVTPGVIEIRLLWPPGQTPLRIDTLINGWSGAGIPTDLADIEFELLGIGSINDPPLPSEHVTVALDELFDASVEGELDERVTGLPGVRFVERRCDTLIGDCDCSCRVRLFEVQAGLDNFLSSPKSAPICMKLDYETMTAADLQRIISHYVNEEVCSDITELNSPNMACCCSFYESLTFGVPSVIGSSASVDLILSTSVGMDPSLLSAVIDYDPATVTSISVSTGPVAANAGKQIDFMNDPSKSELRLVIYDIGDTRIPNGIVARVELTLASGKTIDDLTLDMVDTSVATKDFGLCKLRNNSITDGHQAIDWP